jgi:hypothetical protein
VDLVGGKAVKPSRSLATSPWPDQIPTNLIFQLLGQRDLVALEETLFLLSSTRFFPPSSRFPFVSSSR